jgi:hypothetical protein
MMNEQDKEHLRALGALFAMNGYLSKMACNPKDFGAICEGEENNAEAIGRASVVMADAVLKALEEPDVDEGGIATIKKRKYVRKD